LICDAVIGKALEHVDTLHLNVDEHMKLTGYRISSKSVSAKKDRVGQNLQCSNTGTILAGFVALAVFLFTCL
jgi:hypothetical protein